MTEQEGQTVAEVYASVSWDHGLKDRVCSGCGLRMPGYPLDDVPEWCFQCVQAGKHQ